MVAIASQKMTLAIAALILAFTGPSLGAPLSVPEFKATQTFDDGMYHWTPSSAAATSIAIQSPISLPTSIAVPTSLPGAGTTKATTTGPILTSQATSIAIPSVTTAPVESVTPEAPETSEAPSATTSVEEEETTTTGTESAPTGVTETEGETGSEYNPGSIVNKVSSAIKPITKASSAHPTSAHPTTARPTSAHPTSVKPKPSSTGTKSSVAPKPTSTGGGAASGTKVPYTGDGSTWPTMDKWASFDAMWTKFSPLFASSCTSKKLPTNSAAETANIKTAIRTISKKHSVDERVILAMVMQESGGCARVKTTTSPPPDNIPNPGLMQDYKGSHNCEGFGTKECPKSQIDGMIEDGTSFFAEKVKGAGALSPAPKNPAQKYYWALRIYNSGNYKPGDNLVGSAGAATAPYASDMANRLMGVAW